MRPISRSFVIAWAAAVLLVGAFLAKAPSLVLWAFGSMLLAASYYLARRAPLEALVVVAVAALIGPICLVALPGGISLHLGDLCLFVVAAVTVLRLGPSAPIVFGKRGSLLGILLALVLLGWGVALDPIAAAPTIVGIAELVLVMWLTLLTARTADDAQFLIGGWIAAVTLASVLVIVSYSRGEPLILGTDQATRERVGQLISSETVLFRASYFVAGFIFPLACAIVAAATLMLYPAVSSVRVRIASAVSIAVNVVAVVLMGNVTAAVGVAAGLGCGMTVLVLWPRGTRRVILAMLIGVALGSLVVVAVSRLMPDAQLQLLLGRTSDSTSFSERLSLWPNVLRYVLNTPHVAFLGLGPDVSIRLHDHPLLQSITRGGGVQQEAVDSGYLYVLLNYGLLVFGLVLLIAFTLLTDLIPAAAGRRNFLAATLLCLVITWAVMSITQMHGVSKPAFMLMQLLALVECVPRPRRGLATLDSARRVR